MKINIFNHTIKINGSNPVVDYICSEFSEMPKSSDSTDIDITIKPGFISKHGDGSTGGITIGQNNGIYLDRRSPVPIRGIKDFIHNHVGTLGRQLYLNSNRDTSSVEIRYDSRVTNTNVTSREAMRSINRSYIYRAQNLAKVILYNDIEPLIHQKIIQDGGAFIHASCVARNGSAVVISGWGGAGKTSVATELTNSNEWKLVSDDLCLVESQGNVQPYLKRVQVYPYNLDSRKANVLIRNQSLRNRINWKLRSTVLGEKSVRRRVLPHELYPVVDRDYVSISEFIYLLREDRSNITHERSEKETISLRAGATIAHEFSTHLNNVRSITATQPDLWPSVETIIGDSQDIYENAVSSADPVLVRVPQGATPTELTEYLRDQILQ